MPSQLGHRLSRTWQGTSHFSPRHPGVHVQVPSWVLQAPPLWHWQVRLQLKPQVPLGQLMEQSTPCQPAATRTPEHGGNNSSTEFSRTSSETFWRCRAGSPAPAGRAMVLPSAASVSNDQSTQNPSVSPNWSRMPGARGTAGLLGEDTKQGHLYCAVIRHAERSVWLRVGKGNIYMGG